MASAPLFLGPFGRGAKQVVKRTNEWENSSNQLRRLQNSLGKDEPRECMNTYVINQYINLAATMVANRELEQAFHVYEEVLKYNSNLYWVQNELGNVLTELGRLDDAKICFFKAVESCPDFATAWDNLGYVFYAQGKKWLAIQQLEMAIGADPNFKRAYIHLGQVLIEVHLFDRAAVAYWRALDLAPNDVHTHRKLAYVYYKQGLFGLAIETLRYASQLEPDNPNDYHNLALALQGKDHAEEAKHCYDRA